MTVFIINLFIIVVNGLFLIALWHLDVNHNLDRLGEKGTRGIFKITPEAGYRISEYLLIASVFLLDCLVLYLLRSRPGLD